MPESEHLAAYLESISKENEVKEEPKELPKEDADTNQFPEDILAHETRLTSLISILENGVLSHENAKQQDLELKNRFNPLVQAELGKMDYISVFDKSQIEDEGFWKSLARTPGNEEMPRISLLIESMGLDKEIPSTPTAWSGEALVKGNISPEKIIGLLAIESELDIPIYGYMDWAKEKVFESFRKFIDNIPAADNKWPGAGLLMLTGKTLPEYMSLIKGIANSNEGLVQKLDELVQDWLSEKSSVSSSVFGKLKELYERGKIENKAPSAEEREDALNVINSVNEYLSQKFTKLDKLNNRIIKLYLDKYTEEDTSGWCVKDLLFYLSKKYGIDLYSLKQGEALPTKINNAEPSIT